MKCDCILGIRQSCRTNLLVKLFLCKQDEQQLNVEDCDRTVKHKRVEFEHHYIAKSRPKMPLESISLQVQYYR